jgi:ATP-dependent Clp protease ATP-binding subunit ClpB
LDRLRERLAGRKISLELTDAARVHLVRTGYDPNYGARPLKRAIQKQIETRLGRMILKGEVKDGDHVLADFDSAIGELMSKPQREEHSHRDKPAA